MNIQKTCQTNIATKTSTKQDVIKLEFTRAEPVQQKLPLSKEKSEIQAPVSLLTAGSSFPRGFGQAHSVVGDVALGHVSSGF